MEKSNARKSRSVRRTRRDLRKSLIELMKDKSILHISAKEIYETADIGRTTFYAHYKDPYNLLEEIEADEMEYVKDLLNRYEHAAKHNNKEMMEIILMVLNDIAKEGNLLQVLLSENGNVIFQKRFFNYCIEHIQKIIKSNSNKPDDMYVHEGYSVFMVNGIIGIIQYWIKNKMHIPINTLAEMILKLIHEVRL